MCKERLLAGIPNLDIQEAINALAQDSAVMVERGTASGHLKVLSSMVRRQLITLARRQRFNQIQVHMRKPSPRNWNTRDRGMHVSLDLALLLTEAGSRPEAVSWSHLCMF